MIKRDRMNKGGFWFIFIIVLLLVIIGIIWLVDSPDTLPERYYCNSVLDCVAAQCCHPTEAVNSYYAPDCAAVSCTTECTGPLDCGAGTIDCIDNRCTIVPNG